MTPDAQTPAVALTWSGDDAVAGYVVHWGNATRTYAHDVDVLKPAADAQGRITVVVALDGADAAPTYYFAITSYDAAHDSSELSNELSIDAATLP